IFITKNKTYCGKIQIPGITEEFVIDEKMLTAIGNKFLTAIKMAGLIYRHILQRKGNEPFVAEVSMDEVQDAQTPVELFFILSMLADEGIPVATIAPKFTGRFNKGVDYVGNLDVFEKEFEQDLLVIDHAVNIFGLPKGLKLSVHSGSDKFSLYSIIGRLIRKHDKGIHIKTAGTTWLEEVIGLSLAGGEALEMVKRIYAGAISRFDELTAPYATVIDVDKSKLPAPETVQTWNGQQLANALRHIPGHPEYNPNARQLIHVAFKLAAAEGQKYLDLLAQHSEIVGRQVTENLFERHIKRIFLS
ncbi:MAG TPA: tagaturonate epimerase family protein, partial [Bacteroidales bacterium]|nr:tagaturonate epimerase family protein [Bacteroidales bacterium]